VLACELFSTRPACRGPDAGPDQPRVRSAKSMESIS
jgi:hypothetical protein